MATVRPATSHDAALIARVTRDAWAGSVPADSSAHQEDEARVMADLQGGGGLLLEEAGRTIGSVRWHAGHGLWEVCRLGVLPEFRQHGHARRLMHEVEALAIASGVREMRLAVRSDASVKLVQFYQHLGYAIDPTLIYSHANPLNPRPIVMRKALLTHAGRSVARGTHGMGA